MPPQPDSDSSTPLQSDEGLAKSLASTRWIGWSSLFFAMVQSVCSAFVALSGLRILVGAVAFGAAAGALKTADKFHFAAIRIPMMVLALVGSLFNLVALWQVRRLRTRSSSAWRQKPLANSKLNSERLQLALSILTLVLLAVEYYYHQTYGKD